MHQTINLTKLFWGFVENQPLATNSGNLDTQTSQQVHVWPEIEIDVHKHIVQFAPVGSKRCSFDLGSPVMSVKQFYMYK